MKKNEYVSPEVEIVEIATECSILTMSEDEAGGKGGKFPKPNNVSSIDGGFED